MIKKVENCIYCGEKMESITAKKRYCSAKCRLYFNREKTKSLNVNSLPINKDNLIDLSLAKPIDIKNKEKSLVLPQNEPKEGSIAFYKKYGVSSYAELNK